MKCITNLLEFLSKKEDFHPLLIVFIYWLRWVFVALCGLSLVVASRSYSSTWWSGLLIAVAVSCGAQAQQLWCLWSLPWPGIEPVSPASAGRFFTTLPPVKSLPFESSLTFQCLLQSPEHTAQVEKCLSGFFHSPLGVASKLIIV